MKQKTLHKIYISIIAILLLLFISSLVMGVTGAWFGTKREISGKVQLTPGIKVDFGYNLPNPTIEYDESTSEFWLLKYDVNSYSELTDETTVSRLDVYDVRPNDKIAVVNPILTSLTTDNFYLRAKLIYRDEITNEILTDEQMNEAFGTQTPINFGDNWLVDENGEWAYYVGNLSAWTGGVANAEDLLLIEEYMQVSFFNTSTSNAIKFTPFEMAGGAVEHFSFTGFNVILRIQAIEAAYVNEQFFA